MRPNVINTNRRLTSSLGELYYVRNSMLDSAIGRLGTQ